MIDARIHRLEQDRDPVPPRLRPRARTPRTRCAVSLALQIGNAHAGPQTTWGIRAGAHSRRSPEQVQKVVVCLWVDQHGPWVGQHRQSRTPLPSSASSAKRRLALGREHFDLAGPAAAAASTRFSRLSPASWNVYSTLADTSNIAVRLKVRACTLSDASVGEVGLYSGPMAPSYPTRRNVLITCVNRSSLSQARRGRANPRPGHGPRDGCVLRARLRPARPSSPSGTRRRAALRPCDRLHR